MRSWLRPLRPLLLLALAPLLYAQDFTVNLKDTDIQELIKFVAEVTDTTIVVDPAVKGKVKVVSTRPVSRAELYDLFLSILDVHGYTAVRSGKVIRVIQSKDARSASLPVEEDVARVSDEYVTQVIRLDNVSAAKLIPVLRPLVPQQAHMAAYAPSNAIIISDTAANIRRMVDIIGRMDRSATAETEVVGLDYAVASDVVAMLEKLLDRDRRRSGDNEPEVLLVPDGRTNSVLVNGDEMQRARMRTLIGYLDTPLEQTGNVRVIYLEYAQAAEIAEVLTRVMQNIGRLGGGDGAQGRGGGEATIEADEGTNSLIVTADPNAMAALEAVIHRLDIRRAQVLVEAIIVEMEVTDGADLGLQWLFANDDGAFGSNVNTDDPRAARIAEAVLGGGDGESGANTGDFDVGALAGALAQAPGLSLGWGVIDDDLSMTVILNALRDRTNANILSTPSLLTLDNQEAFITVGQNVPFVTGSFTNTGTADGARNPFQTIERENVGITLSVKPHINDGDAVVLDIEQEVSSLTGLTGVSAQASDLITNERKVQTKVLAEDGRVVVLGGLIKDDVQDATQKVPLLGDIPLFGRLFRNDSVNVTKTNLLIFIRPTIIRDREDLDGATALKYREIRRQQLERRERGLMFLDDEDFPVLQAWEAERRQLDGLREESAGGGDDEQR